MADKKREEFIDRCLDNTDRLKNLLNDVSLITRMDDAAQTITKEPLNLLLLIAEVVEDCTPIATAKGIEIENNVNKSISLIGNQGLLMSVFRNLIDNAIAYSGGNRIRIDIQSISQGKVILTVADNGCGVDPEHLSRIFERFYRVDKGRSRALGGTGLGLSIVKNAVMLHGGTITADNLSGGGLSFTITLSRLSD